MDPVIDRLQRASVGRAGMIGLAGGLPDATLFPRTALHAAFARALNGGAEGRACLQYDWPEGSEVLRSFIAKRLATRGADVTADDVIVTSGAQQALSIATTLLAAPGDAIEVDEHAYPAALDLFRAHDAVLVAPDASRRVTPAFAYVMPGVANPTGRDLEEGRRAALAAAAYPIVADEAYAELRFDGATPTPWLATHRDRTWHVGTFSKTLCPGLRVGYLVPPRAARDAALAAKQSADLQAGTLAQSILAYFLAADDFEARLARTRAVYAERAARLVSAVQKHLPSCRMRVPEGGFSVWVETDVEGDDVGLLHAAVRHGVSFDPGRLFHRSPAPGALSFRLCHSSAPVDQLDEGVRRLARALSYEMRRAA